MGLKQSLNKLSPSNIGHAIKSIFDGDNVITTDGFRGFEDLPGTDSPFFEMFGGVYGGANLKMTNYAQYMKAYFACPPLSAIINRKAQAFINGRSYIINTNGQAKNQEATNVNAERIRKLMDNPNRKQTGKEFRAQNYIYTQLFGFCVVLGMEKPVGYNFSYCEEMWNISPHWLTINERKGIFYKGDGRDIERIQFDYGGESIDLPLDSVVIIRDIMPNFSTVVIPDSRVKTLEMPINNIIGAYESRGMLINSRGALGMLTNQTQDAAGFINLKPDDKKQIQRDFKRLYGLTKHQSHVIITSANLKWQSMVLPTKDLMLFEEIEDSGNRICDAYMFPPELFAKMAGGTTFSNLGVATRNLYQDAIIPEAEGFADQWNKIFECSKYNLEYGLEYKHLAALQAASKEEAESALRLNQALQIEFRNDLITMDEWRIQRGREPWGGERGTRVYSDIIEIITASKQDTNSDSSIESTQVSDNINPEAGNDGLPGSQK